ncbi:MAG: C69 family dipeptidase [Bacteroidales bacterium]|nr:C69 family dipeptidase [Candidatus Colicola faecequi]
MKKLFLTIAAAMMTLGAMACTNFLVGRLASNNGQTMITYAADSYSLYGFLRYQPAADHQPGEMRKVYDWDTNKFLGEIPEVAHTYSVIGNMNEKQLTIGETTYGGRLELMDTTGVMDYGSLIYIALERCANAREAILCIADLAGKYGYYSEGESFSIADPKEVWIMELIGKGPDKKGIVWVATRIPDDCISAHANQARITTLPLKKAKAMKGNKQIMTNMVDGQEWWWSKDVIEVAREKGYFSGNDADFSFCDAYAPLDLTGAYACEGRVWSFMRKYDESYDQYLPYVMHQNNDHMPLFTKPNRKLAAADLREAMRDMYEGTPLDIQQQEGAGIWHSKLRYGGLVFTLDSTEYCYPRPTATQQSVWSFLSEMHADKDFGTFWFGVDDAATNVYIPFFSCANKVPYCMQQGNGDLLKYSHTSAFWAFNTVANYAYTKYERMLPEIRFRQAEWEKRFDEDLPLLENKIGKMSVELRNDYLSQYSCTQADAVVADWHELFGFLMVKYLDGVEKKQDEQGKFLRTPEGESTSPNRLKPNEEYLRSIAPAVAH